MSNQPQTPTETPTHTYLYRVVEAACRAPDLSQTEAASLPYVYSTTVDGPLAVAVLQDVRRLGLFAKWAGDFVATDREIPALQVAEWQLLPASSMDREAIHLWLMGIGAASEAAAAALFEQKLGERLAMVDLLDQVLKGLGISEHVMIEPITADSIMIGQKTMALQQIDIDTANVLADGRAGAGMIWDEARAQLRSTAGLPPIAPSA